MLATRSPPAHRLYPLLHCIITLALHVQLLPMTLLLHASSNLYYRLCLYFTFDELPVLASCVIFHIFNTLILYADLEFVPRTDNFRSGRTTLRIRVEHGANDIADVVGDTHRFA